MDRLGNPEVAIVTSLSDEQFTERLIVIVSLVHLVVSDYEYKRANDIRTKAKAHPEKYRKSYVQEQKS
jgi:hypothetical protein